MHSMHPLILRALAAERIRDMQGPARQPATASRRRRTRAAKVRDEQRRSAAKPCGV